MRRRLVAWFSGALLGAAWLMTAAVGQTPPPAAPVVAVTNLSVQNGAVSGSLVNNSRRQLRDVRLLIRYVWAWKNERHPGDDNPGRAEYYALSDAIPPGESVRFNHTSSPPLPERSDGHFDTSVEVVGFVEVGE